MRLCVVTPAPPRSHHGNRVTAERWGRLFEELGHRVELAEHYEGQHCDALVALHARRSAASVVRFSSEAPGAPIVLALTGTDLYPDLATSGVDLSVLELADRLVVLQEFGVRQVPVHLRGRTRVIVQSAEPAPVTPAVRHDDGSFLVAVLAHLRPVKDPLRAAEAARLLPPSSTVRVVHLGAELDHDLGDRARAAAAENPRYQWLGELPHDMAMQTLRSCQLLALTSVTEGGANAVCEAIAAGVPVVSSRIDGSVGLLGTDYPGYFTPGDSQELADLLWRVERDDKDLLSDLRRRCKALQPLVARSCERQAWQHLLAELTFDSSRQH
ncbi:MAG: selenoneine biosynthesis selenosugar synthase SenB [Acidimicrobiales bacterium]